MNEIRIGRVFVSNFRGFKDMRVFNLTDGEDLILLTGINGSGKTSFFDAIEWCFTGTLVRFKESNEEKNYTKFIRFQPSNKEIDTEVTIEFFDEKNIYTLTRKLKDCDEKNTDYGEGNTELKLILPDGRIKKNKKAKEFLNEIMITDEWKGKVDFGSIFPTFHLLTQDKLKYFVQGAKAPERHESMNVLLGTERFNIYKEQLNKVSKDIEKDIDLIKNEIEENDREIEKIEALINFESNVNIGDAQNFNEYLCKIISNVNILLNKVNIKQIRFEMFSHDLVGDIKNIKDCILDRKKRVNNLIIEKSREINNIELLLSKNDIYEANKKTYEYRKKAVSLVSQYNDYKFLEDNFEKYVSFDMDSKNYTKNIEELTKKKNKIDKQLLEVKEINYKMDIINSKITQQITSYHTLSNQIDMFLTTYESNKDDLNFTVDSLSIEIVNNSISFGETLIKLPQNHNRMQGELRAIFNKGVLEFITNMTNFKDKLHLSMSKLSDIEKKHEEVNQIIIEYNKIENGLKSVLNESLKFIEYSIQNKTNNNKCPICDNIISGQQLAKKIKVKISGNNPLIEEKLALISNLRNDMGAIKKENEVLLKLATEEIKKFSNIFLELKNYINIIESELNIESSNINKDIIITQKILDSIKKDNLKIMDILEKYQLSSIDFKEIGNIIQTKLSKISTQLQKLDIRADSFSIEINEKEIENLLSKINAFEKSISNLNYIDFKLEASKDLELYIKQKKIYEEIENEFESNESYLIKFEKELNVKKFAINLENLKVLKVRNEELMTRKLMAQQNIKKLAIVVTNVVTELNKKIINSNKQLINSIFNKIYPHPYYRKIDFVFGENIKENKTLQIICYNENETESINPGYVFSSAQVNVVAISIFLSMCLYQNYTKLKTILLDDPIQHMDDINIISFIDVLRSSIGEEVLNKQLVLSTHDEKLYRLFMKKFRNYKIKAFKFITYGLNGPEYNEIK